MPFSPHTPITKPIVKLTEIPDFGPLDDLLLQGSTYGKRPYLIEFRFSKQGHVKLFVRSDKDPVARASGYGYDKKGVAFSNWFTKTFAAELKAIFDQPKYRKQLAGSSSGRREDGTAHPWYCVYRDDKTGHISINGMSGLDNVVEIMQRSVGLDLRYIGETADSALYMLTKHVPFKRKA